MVIVRTQKGNRSRGTAAVEAALVLPILLLVSFGAIKYGWLFLRAQQITNAARYGARVAIRADASTQDVLDNIYDLLGPFGAKMFNEGDKPLNEGADPMVTFIVRDVTSTDIGDITPPPEGEDPIGIGDSITVIITVPAAYVDILDVSLFPDVGDIVASVTMAKEGF